MASGCTLVLRVQLSPSLCPFFTLVLSPLLWMVTACCWWECCSFLLQEEAGRGPGLLPSALGFAGKLGLWCWSAWPETASNNHTDGAFPRGNWFCAAEDYGIGWDLSVGNLQILCVWLCVYFCIAVYVLTWGYVCTCLWLCVYETLCVCVYVHECVCTTDRQMIFPDHLSSHGLWVSGLYHFYFSWDFTLMSSEIQS